ncbi:YjcZ family sporulation protein [Halobacillus faecis]|uniref:Sporulation protein YjcZ n=1 Tax=Halobacillus faecis TaxID=360184 RepID=A0A511WQC0_9BACI|nr:YjcZ family sporulation protein [Halobacillus faecis]GEN52641.1 hypothetical protein HFA01_09030 [Halobacillus faecis]
MENVNAPYTMGANVNAPYMGANMPHMPVAPMHHCRPRRNNFVLIVVLFILLIIVGCSIKW